MVQSPQHQQRPSTCLQQALAAVAHDHMAPQPRACCVHIPPQQLQVAGFMAGQMSQSSIAGREAGCLQVSRFMYSFTINLTVV